MAQTDTYELILDNYPINLFDRHYVKSLVFCPYSYCSIGFYYSARFHYKLAILPYFSHSLLNIALFMTHHCICWTIFLFLYYPTQLPYLLHLITNF